LTTSLTLNPVPDTIDATAESGSTSTTFNTPTGLARRPNHLACRRILDLLRDTLDVQRIAHLDPGLRAHVQDDLSTGDGGNQPLHDHGAHGDAALIRDHLGAHLLGGFLDGLADDRVLEGRWRRS
jgi:hypothetical protein